MLPMLSRCWCHAYFTGLMFFEARLSPLSGLPTIRKLMDQAPRLVPAEPVPRSGLGLRRESRRVVAHEIRSGNRCTADQLPEGIGHAVVAVVAIQLAHGDH